MIKSITTEQQVRLQEAIMASISKLQDYSIILQQHNLDEANSQICKHDRELRELYNELENLQDRPPIVLDTTPEDRRAIKAFGYCEAAYLYETGNKIEINNFSQFEGATLELNKLKMEDK